MSELDITGQELHNWLIEGISNQDLEDLRSCFVYSEENDKMVYYKIDFVEDEVLHLYNQKQETFRKALSWLNGKDKMLYFPASKKNLYEKINASKSSFEKKSEEAQNYLLSNGIDSSKLPKSDRIKLAVMYELMLKSEVPVKDDLFYLYDLIWESKQWQIGISFYNKLLELNENVDQSIFDCQIRLFLAVINRHSGKHQKAVELTDIIDLPQNTLACSRSLISKICTTRAAALLDRFEFSSETIPSEEAKRIRRYLDRSWAIDQSPETSLVYKRLDKILNEMWEEKRNTKPRN